MILRISIKMVYWLDFWHMSVSRPSRVEVLWVYFKRFVRWRRNSDPYISGDAFADFADYVYKPPRWRNFNDEKTISSAKVVFCRSDQLQEFLDAYSEILTAKVIICGNSDFEFHKMPQNLPSCIRAMFLQNSFISDNRFVFTIPIGLENFRLGVNGNPKFISPPRKEFTKLIKVLFGPLSPTHEIRSEVIQTFTSKSLQWDLLSHRLKPSEYNKISKQYRYVAAVRGNGVDTHRLWEALYRGIHPIVLKDDWWSSLKDLFPQVIEITSWDETEIRNLLEQKEPQDINPSKIEPLWMPFWRKKIEAYLES